MIDWKRIVIFGTICMLGFGLHRDLQAQNPFGDAAPPTTVPDPAVVARPFNAGGSAYSIPEGIDTAARLILETIASGNPTRPEELSRAVASALDIEQFAAAKFYLDRLMGLNLSDAEKFDLYKKMGGDFFLRIHGVDEWGPDVKDFVRGVMNAVEVESVRPERLDGLIKKLSHQNNVVRSAAFRELRRTGPEAAAAMLNVFADRDRQDEFVAVRTALRVMGNVAIGPLLGAATSPRAQVRYEALTGLSRNQSIECFDTAMGAVLNPATHPTIREAVELGLEETYGSVLPRELALERLYGNAKEFAGGRLRSFETIRLNDVVPYATLWTWNIESDRLEQQRLPPATASRLFALDRAVDLYAAEPSNPKYRTFYLMTFLDAQKRLIGPRAQLLWGDLSQRFPGINGAEIDSVISLALAEDQIAAAAGGCDLLGQADDGLEIVKTQTVQSGLISAFRSGDVHLQFCALRTIQQLDPQSVYFGSSYAMSTAVFLAGYGQRPSGLVGHNQIDIAQNLAVALDNAGVAGRAVSNSREFFREATSDSNIQFLFISDTLFRPDYLELAQQLRMDPRTRRTPIAILTTDPNPVRAQRIAERDPRMIVMPLSTDSGSLELQVQRLKGLVDPWPLSNEAGQLYSIYAVNWLKNIVGQPDVYGFYEPLQYQNQLVNLIYSPSHVEVAIDLLGNMGTPTSQVRLLDYASQSQAPIELRRAAAQGFVKALRSKGLLITTDDLKRQYARYAGSQSESGESQRILGSILDAIEQFADDNTDSR